jgi:hypothetical protein
MLGLVLAFAFDPRGIADAMAEPGALDGVVDSLSGTGGAIEPAKAAGAPATVPAPTPQPAGAPIPLGKKPDYYTRRAIDTVRQDEKAAAVVPHALAAGYPGYSVVVCEAGCGNERGAEIVYLGRRAKTEVVKSAAMVPTSSSVDAQPAAPEISQSRWIDCIGGCYGTPKRYAAPAALKETRLTPDTPSASPAASHEPKRREPFSPIR